MSLQSESFVRGGGDEPPARPHPADTLLVPRDSDDTPTLSVVLPTMDEEHGVADCIRRVKNALLELDVAGEIIVSDSSEDRTPDIARHLGAHVVHPDGEGYGRAYQHAFAHARGDYVAIGDADATYDFEELPLLYARVADGGGLRANGGAEPADLVIGSRFAGEIKPGAMPALHRYVGNPLLTRFLNAFFGAGVSDAHSGFRVVRREALEAMDLSADGMEFASEMIMEAAVKDLAITEVPITYHPRVGEATLDSFRDGWRHVKFMLVNAPGYLFSVPGIAMAVVGLTVMALAYFDVHLGPTGFGVHSMVAGSLLVLVGYQVASMAVFATVAGEAIRMPQDRFTTSLVDHLSLERGVTAGLLVFTGGAVYATYMVVEWISSGFTQMPVLMADFVAFTAIVLGVQTVFGAFLFSSMAGRRD